MIDGINPLQIAREFVRRRNDNPMAALRLLPPQLRFVQDPSRFKLFRAGGQYGKTTIACWDVIHRCLGTHPFLANKKPVRGWIVCSSEKQSVVIQKKLYDLVPKSELDPKTLFDEVIGFRGRQAVCRFKNGSWVKFKTMGQNPVDLASDTLDFIVIDEPPRSERHYAELVKRVQATNGTVMLSLTPVNADCSWLQKLCDAGQISDHHARLTPENLIPVGSDRPLRIKGQDGSVTICDAAWIRSLEALYPSHEVPVTVHGEWEFRAVDSIFRDSFRANVHVAPLTQDFEKVFLGIDYGSGKNHSQYACLVVQRKDGALHVIDEYVSNGRTTSADDAAAVLQMLSRNRLKWSSSDIDAVHGDRVYMSKTLNAKSNTDFFQEVARQLRTTVNGLKPEIHQVKTGQGRNAGSVALGTQFIHQSFLANKLFISPKCQRLIVSINKYTGKEDEYRHAVDTLRYACDDLVFQAPKVNTARVRFY